VSRVFDDASTCLGAGTLRTLRAVILPTVALGGRGGQRGG
jgi:ABC-type spermidine/putrescine transport system permease subunit II